MTRSATRSLKPSPADFYCHSCGRHTSSRRSQLDATQSATPPKFCSKRCRSERKPGLEIVIEWRRMLDERRESGKDKVVTCSEVESRIFDPLLGRRRGSAVDGKEQNDNTVNPQALGMINARNREKVRQTARLLVHFGFGHFRSGNIGDEEQEDVDAVRREERKVQAEQGGKVLEDVTHAKGEWGLRWGEIGKG